MRILATFVCTLLLLFSTTSSQANPLTTTPVTIAQIPDQQYATLTFHDIRDDVVADIDRDPYAINTQNLAQFFDWMQRNHWQPISLQQVIDAQQGKAKLPPNAVLLTFDDGAASHYDKLFPLLKAYQYPAVLALITGWLEDQQRVSNMPSEVYGYNDLLTWQQAKEMHQSGLVEFATHTHRLHQGIPANPQGNMEPAALTKYYGAQQQRYETEAEYIQRIKNDLLKSSERIERQVGVRPRAVVWPYGAVSPQLQQIASSVGLPISFGLNGKLSQLDAKKITDRLLIINDPSPIQIKNMVATAIQPEPVLNNAIYLNLDSIYSDQPAQLEKNLDQLLERVKALKVKTVYLKAFADTNRNGSADALYFPNQYLPVRADLFNRVAWQLRTRAFVNVYAVMPLLSYELPDAALQQSLSVQPAQTQATITNPRLSPFLPQSQHIVSGILTDLANNFAALSGIVIGSNAYILDAEDSRSCDFAARWPSTQQKVELCAQLTHQQREQAIHQFAQQVTHPLIQRTNQSNNVKVAYELGVLSNNHGVFDSQANVTQLTTLLSHYDEVLLSLPLLENTATQQKALTSLSQAVLNIPMAKEKVIFNIRTTPLYPIASGNAVTSSTDKDSRLQHQLLLLAQNKIINLSYMPEAFLKETKRFSTLYQGISLNDYPHFYREPNLEEAAP
jgi:biofilm PGA synthesis lipoprotein PgaB